MATKNPRLMLVLEPPLYRWVKERSKAESISLSAKLRDLVREAYEFYEDRHWAKEGEDRLRAFDRKKSIPHTKFWKHLGL